MFLVVWVWGTCLWRCRAFVGVVLDWFAVLTALRQSTNVDGNVFRPNCVFCATLAAGTLEVNAEGYPLCPPWKAYVVIAMTAVMSVKSAAAASVP